MSRKQSIPRKDADFHVVQNTVVSTANKNRTAWGIDSQWMDVIMSEKADWDVSWEAYENPVTRTILITSTKNSKREMYEKSLRKLVKFLQSNPLVTSDELNSMGIIVPSSTKTAAKVASTCPDFDIDSSIIRRLIIFFYNHGQKKSKAKPEGQHGVEIKWAILNSPPGSLQDLTNSSFSTHSPFILEFDESKRGETVYFCLCWENTRGEKGPWSIIQSAIIP